MISYLFRRIYSDIDYVITTTITTLNYLKRHSKDIRDVIRNLDVFSFAYRCTHGGYLNTPLTLILVRHILSDGISLYLGNRDSLVVDILLTGQP